MIVFTNISRSRVKVHLDKTEVVFLLNDVPFNWETAHVHSKITHHLHRPSCYRIIAKTVWNKLAIRNRQWTCFADHNRKCRHRPSCCNNPAKKFTPCHLFHELESPRLMTAPSTSSSSPSTSSQFA